jgi:hypothetical protein
VRAGHGGLAGDLGARARPVMRGKKKGKGEKGADRQARLVRGRGRETGRGRSWADRARPSWLRTRKEVDRTRWATCGREKGGPREGEKKRRVGRRERNRPKGEREREFLLLFLFQTQTQPIESK